MSDLYQIRDVTSWPAAGAEVMGTKPKVWLVSDESSGGDNPVRWLFKERHRLHTGDDWAEKIAATVAELLGIPHSTVELARRGEKRGIVTRDLVKQLGAVDLVLGNSLLVEADPEYPGDGRFHVAAHTWDRVYAALSRPFIGLPAGTPDDPAIRTAPDLFVGYLMLDALVGNTDRHHENWAVLQFESSGPERVAVLCPSFDDASCLGHNLQDDKRRERLAARDPRYGVFAFVRSSKFRSALYRCQDDRRPLSPKDAFLTAAESCPDAAGFWVRRLAQLPSERLTDLVSRVPDEIMTEVCKRFACEMLVENRANLLSGTS